MIRMLRALLLKFVKPKANFWLFSSYIGKYDDSPKVLSEFIHEHDPQIQIYWLLKKENYKYAPNYVNCLDWDNESSKLFGLKNASVIVDNIMGPYCEFLFGNVSNKKRLLFKFKKRLIFRNQQKIYSFWHGIGIKKGINDRDDLMTNDILLGNMRFLLSSKEQVNKIKRRTLEQAKEYYLVGSPRNDRLLSGCDDKEALKKALCLPTNKKIILFAPTFRGNTKTGDYDIEMSGIRQIKEIQINRILDVCSKRFGGEFVFVLRLHHLVEDKIDNSILQQTTDKNICLGNVSPNMVDYLLVTDVLISDYSSSMFDFILTKKPIFVFAPDLEEYKKKYGVTSDLDDLPFPCSKTADELVQNIINFKDNCYNTNCNLFIKKEGYVLDKNSVETVYKIIKEEQKRKINHR